MNRLMSSLAAGVLAAGLLAGGNAAASGSVAPSSMRAPAHQQPGAPSWLGRALPSRVAAPYVDVTAVDDLAKLARQSGSRSMTLAFLQTEKPGSCDLAWAGDPATPVAGSILGRQIDQLRQRGGEVIPSLGGYSADTTNTELADSCTDVHQIALSLEKVFTTYRVHRVDLDIEADSITNTAGIDRRNAAIAEVQQWGARHHYPVSFSYTLPSTPQGLAPSGMAVLASAAAHHAKIAEVNVMTFDYWDGAQHDMLADAKSAAPALTGQLKSTILPHASARQLWQTVGITQMIGIDDFGPTETYTPGQARSLVKWARGQGVQELSFWALGRDNGDCPGQKGQDSCSAWSSPPGSSAGSTHRSTPVAELRTLQRTICKQFFAMSLWWHARTRLHQPHPASAARPGPSGAVAHPGSAARAGSGHG